MSKRNLWTAFAVALVLSVIASGCFPASSDWTRRDMPTEGLEQAVTYNLRGPADSEREENYAKLRGVNENAPLLMQETIFDRMSGSKTQDVRVTLPDGRVAQALGMVKTKRAAGLTRFLTVESATYAATDYDGNSVCGAKIRMKFNRNFIQYADPKKRDWDALWYYDIPCSRDGEHYTLQFESAELRALVVNEVWQARIASGSFFFNWGHSVTAIGGPAARLPGGWWTHWDSPGTEADAMGAYKILNDMVLDLESSAQPWLEFKPGGEFRDAHLIYSAGDADQYWNWDRVLLNRQKEYAVFYRPNRETPWDYIIVKPLYNYEWNDVHQVLAGMRSWNGADPMHGRLDASGMPKDPNDPVVKELERIGWMNAPNASLEQIQFISSSGEILYAMTVRAFVGAEDSLIVFGEVKPDLSRVRSQVPAGETLPKPVLYDEKGRPLPDGEQPYTDEQWAAWCREATVWNWLKDNPGAVGADLFIQYRFTDNTTWNDIRDSDGNLIGWEPIEWDLSTSYYFDGDVRRPWLISQLLGEVGVRTLGMSYASGRFEGTGVLFAMVQLVHREEFYAGYQPESIWRFDARASQLPDTLAEAWAELHGDR